MLTTLSYRGLQELWPLQLIKSFITADKLDVPVSAAVVARCHSQTTYCKECPLAWLALQMYFFVRPPPEIMDAIVILSDQVSYIYWMWQRYFAGLLPLFHCCSVDISRHSWRRTCF